MKRREAVLAVKTETSGGLRDKYIGYLFTGYVTVVVEEAWILSGSICGTQEAFYWCKREIASRNTL